MQSLAPNPAFERTAAIALHGKRSVQIRTERLLLREFTRDDEKAYLGFQTDPRYTEFHGPEQATLDDARDLLQLFIAWSTEQPRQNYQLAIADLRNPFQLLGSCGLRLKGRAVGTAEFGLELAAESWGHGYAAEAALALLGVGFRDLRIDEVRSESVSANGRVVALARRIGLVPIGSHPGPAWMSARGWHYAEWQLTREQWERMPAV
jgi:RimJ/RimL family protein N-acetyltransferase